MSSELSDAAPWIAIGAAAAAACALLLSLAFYLKLRAVRRAQQVLLGGGQGRPRQLRRLAPDPHRRPPPGGGRGRGRARPGRPARGRMPLAHSARPLRRLRGCRRTPVGVAGLPRRGPLGGRRERDPGPRLRAHLRQATRPRARAGGALARGAGGGRPGDGRTRRRPVPYRKADIRPFESEDEPLLFGLASLDRGADERTLGVLERETVFVAEVEGAVGRLRRARAPSPEPCASTSSSSARSTRREGVGTPAARVRGGLRDLRGRAAASGGRGRRQRARRVLLSRPWLRAGGRGPARACPTRAVGTGPSFTICGYAAGSRPERELRAAQRLLGAPGARSRVQGQGRGHRGARAAVALGHGHLSLAARDPARPLRSRAAGGQAEDLPPGALRARRASLRLLRLGAAG